MVWTPARTWTNGEYVPASAFNSHVRDNLNFLYARSCRLRLSTNTTTVGNVDAGEDNLMTYVVPANTLPTGVALEVFAWGTTAANANVKTLRFYFGSTGQTIMGVSAAVNYPWICRVAIIRTSATTQIIIPELAINLYATTYIRLDAAEDLTAAVTLKFTGEAVATNDIEQYGMIVILRR